MKHTFHIFSQMRAHKQLNLTQVIGLITTKIYCYFLVRLSLLVYKGSHQNLNDIQFFFFWHLLFSSPEPKAQLSFSDQNLSIVSRCHCFRCCFRCCRCKLFTFSSSSPEPLSQFQPNWHKASLGEGDSSLFKWRTPPPPFFHRGDNYKIAKIHWQIFFSRTTEPISTKLGTIHPWVKGVQVCSNEGLCLFPRGDNYEIAKIHWWILKIFFCRTTGSISIKLGTNHPWVKGILVYSNEGPRFFPSGDNYKIVKN